MRRGLCAGGLGEVPISDFLLRLGVGGGGRAGGEWGGLIDSSFPMLNGGKNIVEGETVGQIPFRFGLRVLNQATNSPIST